MTRYLSSSRRCGCKRYAMVDLRWHTLEARASGLFTVSTRLRFAHHRKQPAVLNQLATAGAILRWRFPPPAGAGENGRLSLITARRCTLSGGYCCQIELPVAYHLERGSYAAALAVLAIRLGSQWYGSWGYHACRAHLSGLTIRDEQTVRERWFGSWGRHPACPFCICPVTVVQVMDKRRK